MLSDLAGRLVSPPRSVPLPVACSVLLGNVGGLGAIFFVGGLLFALIFGAGFSPLDELRMALATEIASGVVTDVAGTSATENEAPVYRYEFVFTTADGREITGQSYTAGRVWSAGDSVQVRYVPSKPSIARMEEARRSVFSPWIFALTLIFPLVGGVLFAVAAIRGLRWLAFLRHGEVSSARLLSQRATNVRVNDKPVMEYTYEFEARDGESYPGSSKAVRTQRIGDEAREPVLYLPRDPYRSVLIDGLPLRHPLDADSTGQWSTSEGVWPIVRYGLVWGGIFLVLAAGLLRTLGVF